MRKLCVITAALIFTTALASANDKPQYAVNKISDEALKNANIVFRKKDVLIDVANAGKATVKKHFVFTLLNSQVKHRAGLAEGYDKQNRIKSITGFVYDADGVEIKRFRNSDIRDQSAYSNYSLYEDNRVQFIEYTPSTYPVTIEYEVETEHAGMLEYHHWRPRSGIKESVEYSSVTLSLPKDMAFRKKGFYLNEEPEMKSHGDYNTYTWKAENLPAVADTEYFMPHRSPMFPELILAPVYFEYGGVAGKMDTWENFGKWQYELIKGRDELPPERVAKVKRLTEGMSEIEKINFLYNYLQKRTRYVSIQEGIGGLQPFEASVVDSYGYGDCKALSNYMISLLKSVGISSYYAKIKAGSNASPIITDLPSQQTNHVIVCVPTAQDTIWLECTSQNNPFGYLGSFTSDRYALIISEKGGKLVKTKTYRQSDNLSSRYVEARLSESGDAAVDISAKYTGVSSDNYIFVNAKSPEEQKKWLNENLGVNGLNVATFSYRQGKAELGEIEERIEVTIQRFASASGKRLFFTPNILNKLSLTLSKTDERVNPVFIRYSESHVDTVRYFLPEGWYSEFLPEERQIASDFGEYSSVVTTEENSLVYIRRLMINGGLYDSETYEGLVDFINAVHKADNEKIVLKNET